MNTTYVFDFDSTLISIESLDSLARMGVKDQSNLDAVLMKFSELTNLGMEGKMPFDESLRKRVELLSVTRADVQRITEELKENITDSALEIKDWFIDNADSIYVVSGGFEDYIIPVVEELGISAEHVYGNRFVYDENDKVVGFDTTSHLARSSGKVAQVAELGLSGHIIMIGDGMTDYEVRAGDEADEFWAFTQHVARSTVVERADRVLTSFEDIEEATEFDAFYSSDLEQEHLLETV